MSSVRFSSAELKFIYTQLQQQHGPQSWWPGDTPFEVMVGSILTQNTAWTNVEKAIASLKSAKALNSDIICNASHEELAGWIKPSGYFNVKAKRLRNFCQWYLDQGGLKRLQKQETQRLREGLLSVNGVGPETADDMLLYAFCRPVFVVDAYTQRIFQRFGLLQKKIAYETLRATIERTLGKDTVLYNEYHALIVMHGKNICRTKPLCMECDLKKGCSYFESF